MPSIDCVPQNGQSYTLKFISLIKFGMCNDQFGFRIKFNFQSLFVPSIGPNPTHQFLYLEVDRNNIVEETLMQIRLIEASELRKPLKVGCLYDLVWGYI